MRKLREWADVCRALLLLPCAVIGLSLLALGTIVKIVAFLILFDKQSAEEEINIFRN